ncbi:unnamed protein product [Tenebrio molitor]|nr:unnamed protein product [Tenebrio molitor]
MISKILRFNLCFLCRHSTEATVKISKSLLGHGFSPGLFLPTLTTENYTIKYTFARETC